MAGSSNTERKSYFIAETTVGTIPSNPTFKRVSASTLNMTATPRIAEQNSLTAGGERTGIAINGIAVSGSMSSGLIYGEFDDFLASLFQGTWTSNVLKNAKGQSTFSIEDSIPAGAGSATIDYLRYRGVEATGGTISLTAGQSASITFDLLGLGSDDASTTGLTGVTYTQPTETDVIGSNADIGTIAMSGLGTLDCMLSCEVNFTNTGKDEQLKIGSNDGCGISRGAMVPTVSGQFYVEDNFLTIYNAARVGTKFSLTIPIGSVTGKKYSLVFPSCAFSEAPLVTAESGPAFQNFTILPLYSSTDSCTVKLTRAIT